MVVDDGQIVRDSDQINQKDTIVQVQKKPENENDDGDSLEEVESPQQPVTVAQKKDAQQCSDAVALKTNDPSEKQFQVLQINADGESSPEINEEWDQVEESRKRQRLED